MKEYKRSGLLLSEDKREKLLQMRKSLNSFPFFYLLYLTPVRLAIANLEIQFQNNLNEESSFLIFSKEELAGVPEELFQGFAKAEQDDRFKITLKYPDVLPILRYAKNDNTRKQLNILNYNKCKEVNAPLLQEALHLRKGNQIFQALIQ